MTTTYGLGRHFFPYISDDGNTYEIATTDENGVTVNASTAQDEGTDPVLPRGWAPRHVFGVASYGSRTKCPILDPANTMWVGSGKTFSKHSKSYTILGRVGERRVSRGAKALAT
jgi:hypothetical protein